MDAYILRPIISLFSLVTILLAPVYWYAEGYAEGYAEDFWPALRLPVPAQAAHRQYLGLPAGDVFSPAQIDAPVVVVQIFSMYCPICQREAPRVNRLYQMISGRADIAGKIRIIGIGAGNSSFEVDFYRKSYDVPFPLFADGDFKIHRLTGEVGTPYFYVLKRNARGVLRQVHQKSGPLTSAEDFLNVILEKAL